MNRIQKISLTIAAIALGVILITLAASSLIKKPKPSPSKDALLGTSPVATLPQEVTVSAWVWEYPTELQKNFAPMVDFSKKEGINTLNIYLDEYIDIYEMPKGEERDKKLQEYTQAIIKINTLAKASGIKIQALSGAPNYSYDSHDYIAPLLIDHVFEFNNANPDIKFEGIQFDIEFYEDKRFFGSAKEYTTSFKTLVSNLATKVKELNNKNSQNLSLGFVIPFWFDEANEYTETPIVNDLVKTLNELPNSYLIIMAYRNIVEGQDGVMEVSRKELELTKDTKVKVLIAQELVQNREKKITHFGKSREEIKADFTKIINLAKSYPSFGGITIHDLPAFMETK